MEMLNLEMSDQPKGPARVLSIAEDADRLKAWSYDLADVCPVSAVSDMLRRLASMNVREVDQYVVTFLQ
jgi:hypothetical protein